MKPRLVRIAIVLCAIAVVLTVAWRVLRTDVPPGKMQDDIPSNVQQSTDQTAVAPGELQDAIRTAAPKKVKRLLSLGANPNSVFKGGETAMHEACKHPNLAIISALLESGADPNVTDDEGYSPYDRFYESSQLGKFMFPSDPKEFDETMELIKRFGEVMNRVDKLLMDAGAKPVKHLRDIYDDEMYNAISAGDRAKIEQFIREGRDVNRTSTDGYAPLDFAVCFGQTNTCRMLIAAGANVHKVDKDGATILFSAVQNNYLDIAKLLLDAGASPNARSKRGGSTPLHVAYGKGNAEIIKLLIERGADPNIKDDKGRTPSQVKQTGLPKEFPRTPLREAGQAVDTGPEAKKGPSSDK
jgi:uncharacterized protein